MGKSDSLLLPHYLDLVDGFSTRIPKRVAFLGQPGENFLSRFIGGERTFHDRSLGNWDVNSETPWQIERDSYDLVVCTRCAYFSSSPGRLVGRIRKLLRVGGTALIDWGLGDHWRFEKYKVGWFRDGEHEHAYSPDNFLNSCIWSEDFESDASVGSFWDAVKSGPWGYGSRDSLTDVVYEEVPSIVKYESLGLRHVFLWPDRPQLYTMSVIGK